MRWLQLLLSSPLVMVAASGATAATIHVPGDHLTIQAGINAASAGDTVVVACGTYHEYELGMKSGVCLKSETGEADCVTIDAQGMGRVFYCYLVDSSASVVGFTITAGYGHNGGGGIYLYRSDLRVTRCAFSGNTARASEYGGAAFCNESSPEFTSCTFSGNSANRGGAVYCASYSSPPRFENCTFSSNRGDDTGSASWGGALYAENECPLCLIGCAFLDNSAADGGAVYCDEASGEFVDCSFSSNAADGSNGYGGAAYLFGCSLDFIDCSFSDNTAAGDGGGMYCTGTPPHDWPPPTLTGCEFSHNDAARRGGGIGCRTDTPLFLDGCAFWANSADDAGGAVYCRSRLGLTLLNSTLSGNTAVASGGGVHYESSQTPALLVNSIIAFSGQGEACHCVGSSTADLLCCDIYGNAGGDWIGCLAEELGSEGNFSQDPFFCDAGSGNLMIDEMSPCAPANNSCGVLIGAYGIGCGASAVETTSWSAIKAMYR